ncbi:MAG: metalloregulator ArsR/SmtB family transcription factor [Ferrimonas sp.]
MSTALTPLLLFKAMADTTRLQSLLLIVHENELCVCELTAALKQSQPKISRHLAQLRQLDILQDRRQGNWVYYQLHSQLPIWAEQIIQLALQQAEPSIQAALVELERTLGNHRPQRLQNCCL